jgi:hypothetical protein
MVIDELGRVIHNVSPPSPRTEHIGITQINRTWRNIRADNYQFARERQGTRKSSDDESSANPVVNICTTCSNINKHTNSAHRNIYGILIIHRINSNNFPKQIQRLVLVMEMNCFLREGGTECFRPLSLLKQRRLMRSPCYLCLRIPQSFLNNGPVNVPAPTNTQATIEELSGAVFSMESLSHQYQLCKKWQICHYA